MEDQPLGFQILVLTGAIFWGLVVLLGLTRFLGLLIDRSLEKEKEKK
jgi:hypothetical protein